MKFIQNSLDVTEGPVPEIKNSSDLLVQVKAIGINRADVYQRQGNYPPPPGASSILGLECSGVVSEIGKGVKKFKVGDHVMCLVAGGAYAEYAVVPEGQAMSIPKGFSFEEAAAIPEAFLTAYLNLFLLGNIQSNQTALIHAGASGVGTAAIQLLKSKHIKNYATVGSDEKAKFCEGLGTHSIQYKKEKFVKVISEKERNGVDVILDPIAAEYFDDNLTCLSVEGRLVLISLMTGTEARINLAKVLRKRLRIIGSTLRALSVERKSEIVDRFSEDFLNDFPSGKLKPIIDSVFQVSEAQKAHKRMEDNLNIGKIILKW